MDTGIAGSLATVLFFLVFVGVLWWAYHRDNKQKFEDAAMLPFQEDSKSGPRDPDKRLTD